MGALSGLFEPIHVYDEHCNADGSGAYSCLSCNLHVIWITSLSTWIIHFMSVRLEGGWRAVGGVGACRAYNYERIIILTSDVERSLNI